MNQEVKDYLEGLREERARLARRIAEIDTEMAGYGLGTAVVKKCESCNGSGTYWDRWAGGIDCPHCGASGYVKA